MKTLADLQVEKPEFWEKAWEEAKKEAFSRRKRKSLQESIAHWNKKAARFSKNVGGERGKKRVERVFIWLQKQGVNFDGLSVLDIGAGPGAFALGFAERVREVVALEPAGAMVAYLEEQIARKKIDNVRIIQDTWEEVNLEKQNLKKQFDLVFASMSPGINNWETINKALQCTRKYCFISGFAGRRQNNALAELWQSLYGEKPPAWSISMLYYLNLLYTKGFAMNVEIWEENRQHESKPEEAVSILKEELKRYDLEEFPSDEQIRFFVEDRMENGIFRHEYQSRMGQVLVKL
ncbi:MAG: class I SAM-dependent methyltransferase [Firmicutes bacterium]|nr:class I SAM-dependent methyltransferase [Bacillota bacterium]